MLETLFPDRLSLRAAQVVVAVLLSLVLVVVARRQAIFIGRETLVAMLRGIVQIVAVGLVLVLLLHGPQWTSVFALAGMIVAAARASSRRAKGVPGAFRVALVGIGVGSGVIIALMTWMGVINAAVSSVIPVGSMLVFSAMTSCSLALDRFHAEIHSHTSQIEAQLALGATVETVVAPYVQAAVHAGLIPRIDSLRSLGIVWIPGLMAGMLLSGEEPVQAALYQFVVMVLVVVVGGVSTIISTLLIRRAVFSDADQLLWRGGGADTGTGGGKGGRGGGGKGTHR